MKQMLALSFTALFLVSAPSLSWPQSERAEPCLAKKHQLPFDNQAFKLAKTRTPLADRYLDIGSGAAKTCLHVVQAQAANSGRNPLVILLHGIPQSWYAWRKQIDPLVEAGYDVLIPDLPGLGQSARPSSLAAIEMRAISRTLRDLIEWSGRKDAAIVGHDLGGIIAWSLAMFEPQAVAKLVIVSAPHPSTWRKAVVDKRNQEQFMKSRYAYDYAYHGDFFASMTNLLPKKFNLRYQVYNDAARKPIHANAVTSTDLDVYAAELGRANSPLWITRYYRSIFVELLKIREADIGYQTEWPWLRPAKALFESSKGIARADAGITEFTPAPLLPKVTAPTLLVFSRDDAFNVSAVYLDETELRETTTSFKTVLLRASSHWIPEDNPAELTSLILGFLESERGVSKE